MTASNKIKESVETVAEPWIGSPYYADAEKWTHVFWEESRPFKRLFNELDLKSTVELACGHGRHAEQIQNKVGSLCLMDVLDENIEFSRRRLGSNPRLSFVKNDGHTFRPIEDSTITSIFCYDAMVHFSPDIVASYVADARRVLVSGGRALFHHSNYDAPDDRHYGQNPHARNHMTLDLLRRIAADARMEIERTEPMDWSTSHQLDRLTLLQKR